jgi:tRNA1Val (adenine37-N6)-methyltransferase
VVGVEIDQAAASQAQANVAASPFADRVDIIHSSIQDFTQTNDELFDLIVSNPPFFSGGVLSENIGRAEVRHTVKLSHQDLLRSVQRLLHPQGRFCLVLPMLEGLRFQELAASYQLITTHICQVSPRPGMNPNRLLLELGKSKVSTPQTSGMIIYADVSGTKRSEEFTALTQDFYL